MTNQSKSSPHGPKDTIKNRGKQNPVLKSQTSNDQTNPLRHLSEEDFATLGVGSVVFVRTISAADLKDFVPEAASMPDDIQFQMIVGADGTPVLITDNGEAMDDWFDQNQVELLPRH